MERKNNYNPLLNIFPKNTSSDFFDNETLELVKNNLENESFSSFNKMIKTLNTQNISYITKRLVNMKCVQKRKPYKI